MDSQWLMIVTQYFDTDIIEYNDDALQFRKWVRCLWSNHTDQFSSMKDLSDWFKAVKYF